MEFNSNLKILRKHFMESSEKFRSEEGGCWQNGISASADLPQCFRNASAKQLVKKQFIFGEVMRSRFIVECMCVFMMLGSPNLGQSFR